MFNISERDEVRAKFASVMTGVARALERPDEADNILRELQRAEKMDRKVCKKAYTQYGL